MTSTIRNPFIPSKATGSTKFKVIQMKQPPLSSLAINATARGPSTRKRSKTSCKKTTFCTTKPQLKTQQTFRKCFLEWPNSSQRRSKTRKMQVRLIREERGSSKRTDNLPTIKVANADLYSYKYYIIDYLLTILHYSLSSIKLSCEFGLIIL